jgi:hypothetical protein
MKKKRGRPLTPPYEFSLTSLSSVIIIPLYHHDLPVSRIYDRSFSSLKKTCSSGGTAISLKFPLNFVQKRTTCQPQNY